jgi:uncharacterized protein (DUF779 family)
MFRSAGLQTLQKRGGLFHLFQKRTVRFLIRSKKKIFFFQIKMNIYDKVCDCDIFSPCDKHYIAKPLEENSYDGVQIELMRFQLMQWKRKHAKLLVDIQNEKKSNEQLSLDVTTWQARFLSMAAKFQSVKNVTKELDLWFSTTKEQDEKFE